MDLNSRCPTCDSDRTVTHGPIRLAMTIAEWRECAACGHQFYVDDDGQTIRTGDPKTNLLEFRRGGSNAPHFSPQRASTDALNALSKWCANAPARAYDSIEDEDDYLVAKLTWDSSDNAAGDDLNHFCDEHGVERTAATPKGV